MKQKEKLLVSACLLGEACRYDGKTKPCDRVISLSEKYDIVAVCPEVDGGLPTPRTPSERVGDRVMMRDGRDVTCNYVSGAEAALETCRKHSVKKAILKAKSPSCGKGMIYDGTFSGKLVCGNGVCAELLLSEGILVYTEDEIDELM